MSLLPNASVAILLTTYQGQVYLPEQIQSIAQQTHRDWHLLASDDGSTDATCALLQDFAATHPTTIIDGPRRGFAANFMAALFHPMAEADYVAFSDQDDIWEPEKLARGVAALRDIPADIPALYGTRTRLMDTHGTPYGFSPLFTRPLHFRNALVQCFAGGNTLLMNRAALALLRAAGPVAVVSHDWWAYQLISGAGGRILYDPVPSLSYRQHGRALSGSNVGLMASLARIGQLLEGKWRRWNDVQVAALQASRFLLTEENRATLDHFARARKSLLLPRLFGLYRSGIYRQTAPGNAGLLVAALLNRI
ncbi:MAG: glycosyltransferase [Alphaproteobacteria bacterium]|nr:glycosyltransferase [Alphaproteobacteria bacterium]